jgi:hypothetical protein
MQPAGWGVKLLGVDAVGNNDDLVIAHCLPNPITQPMGHNHFVHRQLPGRFDIRSSKGVNLISLYEIALHPFRLRQSRNRIGGKPMRGYDNVTVGNRTGQVLRIGEDQLPSEAIKMITIKTTQPTNLLIKTAHESLGVPRPWLAKTHDRHSVPALDQAVAMSDYNSNTAKEATPSEYKSNPELARHGFISKQ